jgi:hypothetical protein
MAKLGVKGALIARGSRGSPCPRSRRLPPHDHLPGVVGDHNLAEAVPRVLDLFLQLLKSLALSHAHHQAPVDVYGDRGARRFVDGHVGSKH